MEKDTLTIYPQGDLDLVSAKKVKDSLESMLCSRGGLKTLIMNLAEVRFIDSSGLGMLIGCYKLMHGRQGKMMICRCRRQRVPYFRIIGYQKADAGHAAGNAENCEG